MTPLTANNSLHEIPIHRDRPVHGGNLVWAATLADCDPSKILDFSASINPLGLPASAIAALHTHLGNLATYPDPSYINLRSAISQFHAVPADFILPGNGAAELLTWACRDLAALDAVVLPTPAFSDYSRALNAFNAQIQLIPFFSFSDKLQPDKLDNFPIQTRNVGLVLNNPHNPTGHQFSRAEILSLIQRFSLVVVDEAFMDFLLPKDEQSVIHWVQAFPNLVVIRSLTKFYSLPGLRLGYAIAHPDRLQRWQQWRDPWAVNALAAAVGEVVLRDSDFQQRTWDWLTQTRPILTRQLAELPGLIPYPSAANFLLVESSFSVPSLQLELLQRHQILIRDCLSFPELGDRYFRIAIRTLDDNQRLIDSLKDVLQ